MFLTEVIGSNCAVKWQTSFAWLSGADSINQSGIYGGVKSVGPGARQGCMSWLGIDGCLYLFGGEGYGENAGIAGALNDLWRLHPASGRWEWLTGSRYTNDPGDHTQGNPASRALGCTWIDTSGILWLFGGVSGNKYFNDLWMYSPELNRWTYKGSSHQINQSGIYGTKGQSGKGFIPGGRSGMCGWTDEYGRFWLFGGYGKNKNGALTWLNELWVFDPLSEEWTWKNGETSEINAQAVYGVYRSPGDLNTPAGKQGAVACVDENGTPWIFGGLGKDGNNEKGYYNDLWRYDSSLNQWTWMHGDQGLNSPGIYGSSDQLDEAYKPGGRYGAGACRQGDGKIILFGGFGHLNDITIEGVLNDIWQFDPASLEFSWTGGVNDYDQSGIYPVLSSPTRSLAVSPGGRYYAALWYLNDQLFVFGGYGLGNSAAYGCLNDLWTISTDLILPVQWGEVNVKNIDNAALIKWMTLQEQNSDYFILERGDGSGQFHDIGFIPASGDSDTQLQYAFSDKNPLAGMNMYRIRQVDKDEKSNWSKTVTIDFVSSNRSTMVVFPDPVQDNITIQLPVNCNHGVVNIYDSRGRLMICKQVSQYSSFNCASLPVGIYYLTAITNGRVFSKKILKQ